MRTYVGIFWTLLVWTAAVAMLSYIVKLGHLGTVSLVLACAVVLVYIIGNQTGPNRS